MTGYCNDRNADGDRPHDKNSTSFPCDWDHVFNFCYCPHLQPSKCTTDGCNKVVRQICQNAFEQRQGHSLTTILKCCVHHPHSPFNATKLSTFNLEEKQQPEHVSINTSSSELSRFSSSPQIPTGKGRACSVSEKEEAIRAQARMQAQRKTELFSNYSSDDDSSDDDSSDSNAAQPKSVKGRGSQAPRGKNFAFQQKYGMLPTAKNRKNNSIPRRLDTKTENHYIFTTVACYKLSNDLD
jgi:hypothetical protein